MRIAVIVAILAGVGIDALGAVGAVGAAAGWGKRGDQAAEPSAGAAPAGGAAATLLLLSGLVGHASLSIWAATGLAARPKRSVLLLRLALGCWLAGCGSGVAMGARLWPASLAGRPDVLLSLSGGLLAVLLAYLWLLERLAQDTGQATKGKADGQ